MADVGRLIKAEVKQSCEDCGDVTWVYWCGRRWLCDGCALREGGDLDD